MTTKQQLAASLQRVSDLERRLELLLSENEALKARLAELEKKSAVK